MKQVREVLVRQTVVNLHRSLYLLNTPSQFGFDQFLYYKTIYDLLATRLSWRKVSGPKQREVKRFLKILTLLIFQLNAMPSWIVLLLLLETAKCMLSKLSNFIYNTPRLWHLAKDLHHYSMTSPAQTLEIFLRTKACILALNLLLLEILLRQKKSIFHLCSIKKEKSFHFSKTLKIARF